MRTLSACLLSAIICMCLVLGGCRGRSAETVLVVLGNEPLDPSTPTVDMIARVNKAVAFYKADSNTVLLMTGGPTVGSVSEARMMADMAIAQGVSSNAVLIEGRARTTYENARFAAEILRNVRARRIVIVSKQDHLDWAMPEFRKYPVFRRAEPLACAVARDTIIGQMTQYLKEHPENTRVRARLESLRQGQHGAD